MQLRLQLVSTGQYLVLSPDGTLPIEINTTLFNNSGDLLGSKSYQGTCPLLPNKAQIDNEHLMLTVRKQLMVRVWINEYPWKVARLQYTIENQTINYNIFIDASIYINQLKTIKLNNLSDPLINDQMAFATSDDYRAYLLATTTAAPGAEPMVFFPVKNAGAYKTIDPASYGDYPDVHFPVNPYFNAWHVAGDFTGSFLVDNGDTPVSQTQVPFFYLPYILKRIAKFFGFTPVGKWLAEANSNRIVVEGMIPVLAWNTIADYWLYMPDTLVADFLKAARTEFGLMIDFNEIDKVCIIESLQNLETSTNIIDLRPHQVAGSLRETGTSSQAYTITQAPDDKDAIYSDAEKQNLPVLTIGTVATAVQVTDVPMLSANTRMIIDTCPGSPSSTNWRVPAMSQPIYGSTPLDQISSIAYGDRSAFKIRFLYYQGMHLDEGNLFTYPYGSADNLDVHGNKINDYSLALTASSGSFVAIRNLYNYILNGKPCEIDFLLTAKQMLAIKANTRLLVNDFNFAPVYCLLDKLAVDAGDKKQALVKLTVWPKVYPDNTVEVLPGADGGDILPPPVDNGAVWVRLELRNIVDFDVTYPTPSFGQRGDLFVTFWADAAATTPKDVTSLPLRYSVTISEDGVAGAPVAINYPSTETGGEILIAANQPISITSGGHHDNYAYDGLPSTYYTVLATLIIV